MMEFHIARTARERYQFPDTLFSTSGNVVFANMAACRAFAHRMNQVRGAANAPSQAVHAGQLYAMGLLDEASHVLIARYREQYDPEVMAHALHFFATHTGAQALDQLLLAFVEQFPGAAVLLGTKTPAEWLHASSAGRPHRELALEELMMLWIANRNPAFASFSELFDDTALAENTAYAAVTGKLPEFFATRPLVPLPGAEPVTLLHMLQAPASAAPNSLKEQLDIVRRLWRGLLGSALDQLLTTAGEILREEEIALWMMFHPQAADARAAAEEAARRRRELGKQSWAFMPSTADVLSFTDSMHEYERFSPDTEWMPKAVMMAKSTYVWLAQLSRQYGRHIRLLSDIPSEELATLAHRGIDTLWLIGVWERSRASRTIKYLCGNQDAVASAYSLFDYRIADDLGGEPAYIHLRDRAYHYGIRLASDMVPNHMGIDSPWVVQHPEWFLSRWDSPFPAYSFHGPDLSADPSVEIKIEDHYYTQSDAAVVFMRRDKNSGEVRYIYHGNDGTSFPWNDTAQLDYLNPAVREHVIQTILHVARLFPVIRFDAAMTLAKRHYHRLWFPGPGASGAIPSRAEYGMDQREFDRHMPQEFWREVVDRAAREAPGTLLLAEAFWLMEGYFVRTLGMHRVYNSAFMVMTRDEENAKYRSVLKNTLEFDPEIMKRYVNFMSNPDERTAIDQYGKGDKAFGVAVMMATLPGLPMFGHGQVEGYTEKYGMEYQRPRYDESPDPWMVERHEREIAPLLKRRWLFAESHNFLLYDFYHDSGQVDENVFAYSNRAGYERALVIYHNKYGETAGSIRVSAAYADKAAGQLRQRSLWEGLGLGDPESILLFRDSLTGLSYLRRASEIAGGGLRVRLQAYQCHVFLDWQEMRSSAAKRWDLLCDFLNGRGVPDVEAAFLALQLRPAHEALAAALHREVVQQIASAAEGLKVTDPEQRRAQEDNGQGESALLQQEGAVPAEDAIENAWTPCAQFIRAALAAYAQLNGKPLANELPPLEPVALIFRKLLREALQLPAREKLFPHGWNEEARRVLPSADNQTSTAVWGPVLGWCVLQALARALDSQHQEAAAVELFDGLRLREPLAHAFMALGLEGEEGWRAAARLKIALLTEKLAAESTAFTSPHSHADEKMAASKPEAMGEPAGTPEPPNQSAFEIVPRELWNDPDLRWLTGVHASGEHTYILHELYEQLLWWLQVPHLLRAPGNATQLRDKIEQSAKRITAALAAAASAGYRLDKILAPSEPVAAQPRRPSHF